MTVDAAPLHTADWHATRRSGIGGSDIPILAGLSPYGRGIHDVYLEKIGELEPSPSSPAMEVGQVIEDAIATLYTRRTGRKLNRSLTIRRHPDYAWAIGNIDRRVRGEHRLVEIKNRRSLTKAEGLPADIECQVQWYLGVTGYPVGDVAMLVGGNDLRIIEVDADADYFRDLLVIAGDFWRRVEQRQPPDIDGSASAARYLAATYPWHRKDDDLVPATPDIERIAQELRQARQAAQDGLGRLATAENAMRAVIGDAPGVQGAGWSVTWRRSADYARTNWAEVAKDLAGIVPADQFHEIQTAHTTKVEGTRRFVAKFEGDIE